MPIQEVVQYAGRFCEVITHSGRFFGELVRLSAAALWCAPPAASGADQQTSRVVAANEIERIIPLRDPHL
jgi:hypothetical protein